MVLVDFGQQQQHKSLLQEYKSAAFMLHDNHILLASSILVTGFSVKIIIESAKRTEHT